MHSNIRLALNTLFTEWGKVSQDPQTPMSPVMSSLYQKLDAAKIAYGKYIYSLDRVVLNDISDYPREIERVEVLCFSITKQSLSLREAKLSALSPVRDSASGVVETTTTQVSDEEVKTEDSSRRIKRFSNEAARKAEIARRLKEDQTYTSLRAQEAMIEQEFDFQISQLEDATIEARAYLGRLKGEFSVELIRVEARELGKRK